MATIEETKRMIEVMQAYVDGKEIQFLDEPDRCPICADPFRGADICATDIEMGTVHADCLEGCDVVDLESGEPTGRSLSTFRYDEETKL